MSKKIILSFLLLHITLMLGQQIDLQTKDIVSTNFRPERLESIRSLNNGSQYTTLSVDMERRKATIYLNHFSGKKEKTILVQTAPEKRIPFFTAYAFSKNETKLLLETDMDPIYRRSKQAVYWIYDRATKTTSLLFPEKVQEPLFSPDGQYVAFVFRRNIYIKDLKNDSLKQVTFDGNFDTINGITDWVYEEEFGFVRAFDWSPDSSHLVYMRFDESEVPLFSMDIYAQDTYPFPYAFRYPKAGENNSKVQLMVYDLNNERSKEISFGSDDPYYIPRLKYVGGSHGLLVQTLNRHQNHLKLWRINPLQNKRTLILEEKDEAYLSIQDQNKFLADGSFLWLSEQDGYNHIYHYDNNGKLLNQLTRGPWEVTTLYGMDQKKGEIFYQSVENGSIGRVIFALKLKTKKKRNLGHDKGFNGATFSKDYSYFIHSYSDEKTPPKYTLNQTKNGQKLKVLLDNQPLQKKMEPYNLPTRTFSSIEINGETLNMYLLKPKNFDPSKKYPVLLYQYSGPGSQQVSNRWGGQRDLWHKMLTQKGIIVACVDGRGTGFKGARFKKSTYLNLVKYETLDQIAFAKALAEMPFIDSERIGIWGWSFGGHMASHCLLTGQETFSMAIAVAPVTNWRFYDTIYTERFMRTPEENPSGYDLNSPINYADQLEGKYLIIHGSGDDNVHVQNTMRMVEALIQADKQFEWMIYPDKNHGIYGGNTQKHLYTKMTTFILNNL